jgi:hypothetical protein
MSHGYQEVLALAIVFLTLAIVSVSFYRTHLAAPLSAWLLKIGQVKLAMRVRGQLVPKSGCSSCKA